MLARHMSVFNINWYDYSVVSGSVMLLIIPQAAALEILQGFGGIVHPTTEVWERPQFLNWVHTPSWLN